MLTLLCSRSFALLYRHNAKTSQRRKLKQLAKASAARDRLEEARRIDADSSDSYSDDSD